MTDVTNNRNAPEPITLKEWAQNTFAPKAEFQNKLTDLAAYGAYTRTKVVFMRAVPIESIPTAVSADRRRWMFCWNSGPYVQDLNASILMARRVSTTGLPYTKLQIAKLADVTVTGFDASVCAEYIAIAPAGAVSFFDRANNMAASTGRLVQPGTTTPYVMATDTMYCGRFVDVAYGRMVSACVWETSKQSASDYGFSANGVTTGAPIFAQQRDAIADVHRALHTRGAAQLWNHCSETDATAFLAASAFDTGTLAQTIAPVTLSGAGTVVAPPITGTLNTSIGNIGITAVAQLPATFDAFVSNPTTGSTQSLATSTTLYFTIHADVGGQNQTHLQYKVQVNDGPYGGLLISNVAWDSTADMTVTGFTNVSGVWTSTVTFTTAPINPYSWRYEISGHVTLSGINTGHIFISTNDAGAPQTDQATGAGNDVDVHILP